MRETIVMRSVRIAAILIFSFPVSAALLTLSACESDQLMGTAPNDENRSPAADTAAQDRYVTVNGVRLHYRERGGSDAPPLLILHGLTGHAWEFDRIAGALSDDYRVLALSQRGHGASDWADSYTHLAMADDIADFVGALGLDRVRVLGHSMGGVNAWWFAARHPELVERLVITDVTPDVIASKELANAWVAVLDYFAHAEYADPEDAVAEYLADYAGDHADELRTFVLNNIHEPSDRRWRWRFDARGLAGWMLAAAADEDAHWSALRRIQAPTLIVRAGDSPFTAADGAQRMAAEIPRGTMVEVPASGHDIHIDQREALLTELRSFFD